MTQTTNDEFVRLPDEMTPEQQLDLWVNGESIHNNNRYIRIVDDNDNVIRVEKMEGGECCPDFSCCKPELLWDKQIRENFKNADHKTRSSMLGMALSALFATEDFRDIVNIVGDNDSAVTH